MPSDITNYVSFLTPTGSTPCIGHLNLENGTIQPLYFRSGAYVTDLYQLIERGEDDIIANEETDEPIPASSVQILPPISGRDILAVGKNYFDHAKEFNRSGFDSSDKVDVPSHPVIFTKRATSIIPNGADIYHHPDFTQSLDYEGEVGVIIGKAGYRVKEEEAMEYVWGYTIINDVTARERQRDHKQFFIGKSGDTFCPMGPIAKSAKHLPEVLRVQTVVNGEPQQDATTKDLIFSIPFLIKTLSEGITLQPGDVIATGTPAGVGIGKTPPVYLKPGDTISISVTGLGTLTNTVSANLPSRPTAALLPRPARSSPASALQATTILGDHTKPPILFLPHPGASPSSLRPLISALDLSSTRAVHLLSYPPSLSPSDRLDIPRLVTEYVRAHELDGATLIAHGLSSLDATRLAAVTPPALAQIVVIAPVVTPLSADDRAGLRRRARIVARGGEGGKGHGSGIDAVLDQIVEGEVGKRASSLAGAAVRMALEGGSADAYVRWCVGLADADSPGKKEAGAELRAVVGREDGLVSVEQVKEVFDGVEVLEGVGRWPVLEDLEGVARVVGGWL